MNERLILMVILFAFCTVSSNAQVRFGLKGGVSIATQDVVFPYGSIGDPKYNYVLGYVAGISADIPLKNKHISIQPELLYVQKGVEEDVNYSNGYNTVYEIETVNLNYIEVPVLAKFNFNITNSIRSSIYSGVAASILVDSRNRVAYNGEEQPITEDKFTRQTDFGIPIGIDIEYNTITTILLDVRYTIGLENVYSERSPGEPIAKNRALTFMLGFAF